MCVCVGKLIYTTHNNIGTESCLTPMCMVIVCITVFTLSYYRFTDLRLKLKHVIKPDMGRKVPFQTVQLVLLIIIVYSYVWKFFQTRLLLFVQEIPFLMTYIVCTESYSRQIPLKQGRSRKNYVVVTS